MAEVTLLQDIQAEDLAMLQALYSRSHLSVQEQLKKLRSGEKKSDKFMDNYYIGYGDKSIGDCGTTTLFLEKISFLACKAIQDYQLYNGQESSSRYLNFSQKEVYDPFNNSLSKEIFENWFNFYSLNLKFVETFVQDSFKEKHGKEDGFEKAVKARSFDILRGFLPTATLSQCSWTTTLRQASDHLIHLFASELPEIRQLASQIANILYKSYSHSFPENFITKFCKDIEYSKLVESYRILCQDRSLTSNLLKNPKALFSDTSTFQGDLVLNRYKKLLLDRPKGCELPKELDECGVIKLQFLLDYGSFRDLQRHRSCVQPIPVVDNSHGFHPWYIGQLPDAVAGRALTLLKEQAKRIRQLETNLKEQGMPAKQGICLLQYLYPMGTYVHVTGTYTLRSLVYITELRSSPAVHPTLRTVIHRIYNFLINLLERHVPNIPIYANLEVDDLYSRRGLQDISQK